MTAKQIVAAERVAFNAWNKARYNDHSIHGDELAWRAWKAAICNLYKEALAENAELSDRCLITVSRGWAKKVISSLTPDAPKETADGSKV